MVPVTVGYDSVACVPVDLMTVSSEKGTVKNWRDWGMCYSSSLFCFSKCY